MRILFLIDNLGSGGAQRQLITIANLIKLKGYDVEIMSYSKGDFYEPIVNIHKIKLIKKGGGLYVALLKVLSHLLVTHYDVVISFLDIPNFINSLAKLIKRNYVAIISERSANLKNFNLKNRKILYSFYNNADFLVCNSNQAKDIWETQYPKLQQKIKVIYNTLQINTPNVEYNPLKNECLNILVAATYNDNKNPISLIKSLCYLTEEEKSHLKITWFGRPDSTSENSIYVQANKLIQSSNLCDIIKLNKETSHIHDYMNNADLVALFSNFEGLPNVICEAMYLAKPILMTKVSDYSVLVDKSNGFIIDKNTPESIYFSISSIIKMSRSELLSMGLNSKIKANQLFSSDQITSQWNSLFTISKKHH